MKSHLLNVFVRILSLVFKFFFKLQFLLVQIAGNKCTNRTEFNGSRLPFGTDCGFSINFVHIRKPRVRFRDSKIKSFLAERLGTRGSSATVLCRSHFFTVFHVSLPNTIDYLEENPRPAREVDGGEG